MRDLVRRAGTSPKAIAAYNESMPLFEYACRECDHEFEVLVRGSDAPECPSCHGRDLQRGSRCSRPTSTARARPRPARAERAAILAGQEPVR